MLLRYFCSSWSWVYGTNSNSPSASGIVSCPSSNSNVDPMLDVLAVHTRSKMLDQELEFVLGITGVPEGWDPAAQKLDLGKSRVLDSHTDIWDPKGN